MFSCRTRGFCPSCHAKRSGANGLEWVSAAPRKKQFLIKSRMRISFPPFFLKLEDLLQLGQSWDKDGHCMGLSGRNRGILPEYRFCPVF